MCELRGEEDMGRNRHLASGVLVLLAFLLLVSPVQAYVGPGVGLGFLGSLIGVVVATLLALVGLVVIPVRLWLKRRKAAKNASEAE